MTPLIVLFCFAVGAVLAGLVVHLLCVRYQRARSEHLGRDWWPRFEAEFRAYAEQCEVARRRRSASP